MVDRMMTQEIKTSGSYYLASSAVLMGDITLGTQVSIWPNATLRADTASLVIGDESNIQDNVCIHAGDGYPVTIGAGVSVGHGAIVHGCTVGDDTIVGMGAILLNCAKVGKNCLIGAGALVTEGMEIPDGSLAFGSPAKVRRMLTEEEIKKNRENAAHYVQMGRVELEERS